MCKVIIFAGTTEGRELAEYLDSQKVSTYVCTATEYGESLIHKSDYVHVSGKRLNQEEIIELLKDKKPYVVVDATHPYATVVSNLLKKACESLKVRYIRLLREETSILDKQADLVYVDSVGKACEYLKHTKGNVFVTTGSKELEEYTKLEHYKERVYARVLSGKEAMNQVMDLGFEGKNLICMQGPFSEEMNYMMLKETNSRYLVTKESGRNGGFLEKVNAANRLNIMTLVIGRPKEEKGHSFIQVVEYLNQELSISNQIKDITVVGIGIGNSNGMTLEAMKAISKADVIFGARRMLDCIKDIQKPSVELYKKEEINAYLKEHMEYRKIAVLVSGDPGFYSAANQFYEYFKEDKVNYICGISSLSYFCSKIGKSWESTALISNHGKQVNTIDMIRRNKRVFSLMGGKESIIRMLQEFLDYGFYQLDIWVGENLGYDTERIIHGNPKHLLEYEFDTLCVIYIENSNAREDEERILDEEFIRGDVPMTKEEIRTVSISKLELKKNSVVYDIGAGTGSVSIQAAKRAFEGCVYAIEKNPEGILLIEENKKKFQVSNIKVIEGIAPKVLSDLPEPTHAFIGGSSGKLGEMILVLRNKNPKIRIVINAITLETVSEAMTVIKEFVIKDYEITQLQSAKSKRAGNYHMMLGQNPVTIITIG